MRILVIHTYYQHPGGEDIVFQQEIEELRKTHTVETLTFQNKKGWKGGLQFLAYPWNFAAQRRVRKCIQHFSPDVVHIHNLHYASGPAIIRAIHALGLPLVMTLHNFRLLCPSASLFFDGKLYLDSLSSTFPWKGIKLGVLDHSVLKTFWTAFTYWLHRKVGTWKQIDRYIVLTDFAKQLFQASPYGFSKGQVLVKPNFVELETAETSDTRDDSYLYIGRLSAEKGILPLVEAFKQSTYQLKVVGDGPLMPQLQQNCAANPNIELLGAKSKSEAMRLLGQSKALIVPSICYEGAVPLTIIEGMANRTPILASNLGAIPSSIIPEKTGYLFDPYQAESLRASLEEFENSSKKSELVENAYRLYKEKYTKSLLMQQLIGIYEKIKTQ